MPLRSWEAKAAKANQTQIYLIRAVLSCRATVWPCLQLVRAVSPCWSENCIDYQQGRSLLHILHRLIIQVAGPCECESEAELYLQPLIPAQSKTAINTIFHSYCVHNSNLCAFRYSLSGDQPSASPDRLAKNTGSHLLCAAALHRICGLIGCAVC
jgi:hypothetical protein